jgi:hypothetical protein
VGLAETVAAYVEAWNEFDAPARNELLQRAWADDGVYEDPLASVAGRDAVLDHIGEFGQRFEGHTIDLTSGIDEHHGWFRFSWAIRDSAGATAIEGFDIGQLADDGRIKQIVGFFGPFPPLA